MPVKRFSSSPSVLLEVGVAVIGRLEAVVTLTRRNPVQAIRQVTNVSR